VAVWIALRKAHQGGVTNLAGQWRECGSPVPGYVADALDRLTSSRQLALADPDPESSGGVQRVTVTDTGRARYVTLCQVHDSSDSGRPPAETAPGGRPDTTTPVESASVTGDAAVGDPQRGTLETGQVVINPGVHRGTPRPASLPVIVSPEAAGRALGELFLANADRGDDAAVTVQVPAPQFDNSPDSGRPLVEQFPRPSPAPGGRPDTTALVDWARLAADADERDHPSGGREQPRLGLRPGVVIDCCVQLPVTSVDPVTGPSPELVAALVLHRAHGGGVAKLGADYLDHGLPAPGSLAGIFDELLDTGLLSLADPDRNGRRRATLTTAGRTRYERLHGMLRPPMTGACTCCGRRGRCCRHRGPRPRALRALPSGGRSHPRPRLGGGAVPDLPHRDQSPRGTIPTRGAQPSHRGKRPHRPAVDRPSASPEVTPHHARSTTTTHL
jgi:hypothetical protein